MQEQAFPSCPFAPSCASRMAGRSRIALSQPVLQVPLAASSMTHQVVLTSWDVQASRNSDPPRMVTCLPHRAHRMAVEKRTRRTCANHAIGSLAQHATLRDVPLSGCNTRSADAVEEVATFSSTRRSVSPWMPLSRLMCSPSSRLFFLLALPSSSDRSARGSRVGPAAAGGPFLPARPAAPRPAAADAHEEQHANT